MAITARHFTDDGRPLLTAADLAAIHGVKTRTIYQWRRRGFVDRIGMDEDGRELYDAAMVAAVAVSPRNRQRAA